jgi:hypothetical protein
VIHVVVMTCLIGLPVLIHIEILQRSRSQSFKIEESESEVLKIEELELELFCTDSTALETRNVLHQLFT